MAARHEIPTHRPRLLLVGEKGQGHSSHLGPAILHHFESLPVYVLDLPALYAVGMKSPEEACSQVQGACSATCIFTANTVVIVVFNMPVCSCHHCIVDA